MKVRKLIEMLLQDNTLDDEVIVEYYDKNYFVDSGLDRDKVEQVWAEFVADGQDTLTGHIEFTQTGYELADDLAELIKEKEENDAELGE